ncbi:hypothetical protein D9M72_552210 [compost metagenome]
MEHERLSLPHPRMRLRAFVLLPLRDLAPEMVLEGRRIEDWIGGIRDQAIERA